SLIQSGKYRRLLLVGADVHTPFMPWERGWGATIGEPSREPTQEDYAFNTSLRDRTVLFGDGAGAVVVEASEHSERGVGNARLVTDGSNIEALYVPGVGFRRRPYVSHDQVERAEPIPVMEGREVFKQAVVRMPESVRAVCQTAGISTSDIDLLLIHQANLRI